MDGWTEIETCCAYPNDEPALVWFWPFTAKHCRNCGEVKSDGNPVLDAIWTALVWPFWDGRVKVRRRPDDRDDTLGKRPE